LKDWKLYFSRLFPKRDFLDGRIRGKSRNLTHFWHHAVVIWYFLVSCRPWSKDRR